MTLCQAIIPTLTQKEKSSTSVLELFIIGLSPPFPPPFMMTPPPVEDADAQAVLNASRKPVRPRIAPWKAGAFLLTLVVLTPFWLLYGVLGKLLTASSKKLSFVGLTLLTLLSGVVLLEVYLVELSHGDKLVEFVSADDTDRIVHAMEGERNFLQMLALLGFVLAALLVGQWRFHNLVMVCLDQPITATNGVPLLVDMLAPLFFVALLWEYVYAFKHWQFVTGLTLGTLAVFNPLGAAQAHRESVANLLCVQLVAL